MLPILFSIGPLKIYSYGFFMALAFLSGSFVVWRRAKEEAYDEEKIFDAIIFTTLFAFLGARIYYLLFNFTEFGFNLLKWFWLTRYAGLSFHGGLLGGILGLFLFCKREKWDFWQTADMAVFGLVLAQVIGRIGCFLNGCCYGRPTNFFWGVKFAGLAEPRHPTQIYEAVFVLLIFFLLLKLERRYRLFTWYKGKKDKAAPGFLALSYLICYNSSRIFLEIFRQDSLYLMGIRSAQLASGLIMLASLVILYQRSGRGLKEDKELLITRCLLLFDKVKYGMKTAGRKPRKKKKQRVKVGEDVK